MPGNNVNLENTTQEEGVCDFVQNFLRGSYLARRGRISCSRHKVSLGDLELQDVATLIQRCGRHLSEFSDFGQNICHRHLKLLIDTIKFAERYRQYCLWPDHMKGATNAKELRPVSLQDVQDFFKYRNKLIPYGGKICHNCRKKFLPKHISEIRKEKAALDAEFIELASDESDRNGECEN